MNDIAALITLAATAPHAAGRRARAALNDLFSAWLDMMFQRLAALMDQFRAGTLPPPATPRQRTSLTHSCTAQRPARTRPNRARNPARRHAPIPCAAPSRARPAAPNRHVPALRQPHTGQAPPPHAGHPAPRFFFATSPPSPPHAYFITI